MKYDVYAIYTASKYLGEVEAKDKSDAEDKAWKIEKGISLCYVCSRKVELGDPYTIEIKEKKRIMGVNLTGFDIYKFVGGKGVPIIIQNFEVKLYNVNNSNIMKINKLKDYFIVYAGEITPFQYLATTFNINNELIESKNPFQ